MFQRMTERFWVLIRRIRFLGPYGDLPLMVFCEDEEVSWLPSERVSPRPWDVDEKGPFFFSKLPSPYNYHDLLHKVWLGGLPLVPMEIYDTLGRAINQ